MFDCHEFSVLPPVDELANFFYYVVLSEQEDKVLFSQMENLWPDKEARKYVLQMRTEESMEKLSELMDPGVVWPGYWNAEAGRDVLIHGFSMEKPIMDITVCGIGFWNSEEVVRGVVEKWGEVKKLSKVNFTLHGHTFGTDKWEIKIVKSKEIVIPPVVFHLGSDRSSEEREKWEVSYRGMPRICYRCLKEGHLGRECQDNPVDIEQLASDAAYDEAPVAISAAEAISAGERMTFAQIVKDASYTQAREARARAEERRKEEVAAKIAQERKLSESRKNEKEKKKKEEKEKKKAEEGSDSESDSDKEEVDPTEKEGFSIDKSRAASPFSDWAAETERHKRSLVSPGVSAPESKNLKLADKNGDSRRTPGQH